MLQVRLVVVNELVMLMMLVRHAIIMDGVIRLNYVGKLCIRREG